MRFAQTAFVLISIVTLSSGTRAEEYSNSAVQNLLQGVASQYKVDISAPSNVTTAEFGTFLLHFLKEAEARNLGVRYSAAPIRVRLDGAPEGSSYSVIGSPVATYRGVNYVPAKDSYPVKVSHAAQFLVTYLLRYPEVGSFEARLQAREHEESLKRIELEVRSFQRQGIRVEVSAEWTYSAKNAPNPRDILPERLPDVLLGLWNLRFKILDRSEDRNALLIVDDGLFSRGINFALGWTGTVDYFRNTDGPYTLEDVNSYLRKRALGFPTTESWVAAEK